MNKKEIVLKIQTLVEEMFGKSVESLLEEQFTEYQWSPSVEVYIVENDEKESYDIESKFAKNGPSDIRTAYFQIKYVDLLKLLEGFESKNDGEIKSEEEFQDELFSEFDGLETTKENTIWANEETKESLKAKLAIADSIIKTITEQSTDIQWIEFSKEQQEYLGIWDDDDEEDEEEDA